MQRNTLVGIGAAVGCVLVALILDHDSPTVLLNPSALILVVGGTVTLAFAIGTFSDGKLLPKVVKKAITGVPEDPTAKIQRLVKMADDSRRHGLLKLEEDAAGETDPFFRRGISLVVDGKDSETIRGVLEADLDAMHARHSRGVKALKQAGGFAPTLGIIGTVIGLVHVMTNLSSPSTLGPAIGAAFTSTLWGVLSANLFWLPMSAKLDRLSAAEAEGREAIIAGLLAIQAGEPPRTVEVLLSSFLPATDAAA
jgi:chemotaxis protein MotA